MPAPISSHAGTTILHSRLPKIDPRGLIGCVTVLIALVMCGGIGDVGHVDHVSHYAFLVCESRACHSLRSLRMREAFFNSFADNMQNDLVRLLHRRAIYTMYHNAVCT